MKFGHPSHPVVWGIAFGLASSFVGGIFALDVLGFWMGGLLVLPMTGLLGLSYASWRQREPMAVLWWAAGVVAGLVPVTAFLAGRTRSFWLEFLMPLVTGLLFALSVGPLFIRLTCTRPQARILERPTT